jgi:hypothetical protein
MTKVLIPNEFDSYCIKQKRPISIGRFLKYVTIV